MNDFINAFQQRFINSLPFNGILFIIKAGQYSNVAQNFTAHAFNERSFTGL